MTEQELKNFQLQIVRLAKTEEEVRNILWELTRTDWEGVWDLDKELCGICQQSFQHRKMILARWRLYCETCAATGLTRSCHRCWITFHESVFDVSNEQCLACRTQLCQVCQLPSLPLYQPYQPYQRCQFRVICQSCLNVLSLRSDWEHRELRKISTHISHSGDKRFSLREWVSTLQDFSWKCAYCMDAPYEQIDHFIPISKSGCTAKDNCVPACKECNKRKGQRIPEHVIGVPQEALTRVQVYLQQFSSDSEIPLKSS